MKIAVLSGKGGTGKTLVSVNLAVAAKNSLYMDCDVEEPNGYLFLKPEGVEIKPVTVKMPEVNQDLCDGCRKCVDFCEFNALAYIQQKLLVFEEVCHSCGGCMILCPQHALQEKDKEIGHIEIGMKNQVTALTGVLNTGEASGVPIIKDMLEWAKDMNLGNSSAMEIIDCPPGSACIVMESIKEADYCILVGEPTRFGAHNLEMVYDLVNVFKKPHGVILNKCLPGMNPSEEFCLKKKINILGKIPFDYEIGKLNSNGEILVEHSGDYLNFFENILEGIAKEVEDEAIINP